MSDSDKLAAILKMADPSSNSSYQERKVALNKAHKLMDDTGISYASLGFSQADAERIETQFSVSVNTKPKPQPKETRVSIFSRSGEVVISDHPRYRPQPKPKKPKVELPNWEAENERKQREEWNSKYSDWEKWRKAENIKQAQSNTNAVKFFRNIAIVFVLVVIVGIFVLLSQNAVLISAVTLVAKIFGVIFMSLIAIFVIAISR